MGYSRHVNAVVRALPVLELLNNNRGKEVEVPLLEGADPDRTVYLVREGIYASRFYTAYKKYMDLQQVFTIHLKPGHLLAKPKGALAVDIETERYIVSDASDFRAVLFEMVKVQTMGEGWLTVGFENFDYDDSILGELYEWASENDWHLIPVEGGVFFVRTLDDWPEGMDWKPEVEGIDK